MKTFLSLSASIARGTARIALVALAISANAVSPTPPPAARPAPKLSPLLIDKHGNPISTTNAWETERTEIRQKWLKAMGIEIPSQRVPLETKILKTEKLPTFTRQLVKYQIEKGIYTDGYLLTPKGLKNKAPAIVVFHPTTPLQAKGVAGLSEEYAADKRQGLQLVAKGYVVWCPRNFINDDIKGTNVQGFKLYAANAEIIHKRHPKRTGMGRMVLDAVRAADFVDTLPNVDTNRIGALGHSLGGKQVLYAAAFDERYRATVSCEGGIGLAFSNWEAPWYLGEQIKKPSWRLDNHQVLSLVAPRPFLLLAGDASDDERSGIYIENVRPVYKLYHAEKNLDWFDHHEGHKYGPGQATAEAFFDAHLK